MASTIVDPVAERLKTLVQGLGVIPAPKVYWPAPARITAPISIVIEPPDLIRGGLDQPEPEIGSEAWTMNFPLVIYVDLREAEKAQDRAVELVEALIAKTDDDPTLQNLSGVDDTALTEAETFVVDDQTKPLFGYRCTIEVLRLVQS